MVLAAGIDGCHGLLSSGGNGCWALQGPKSFIWVLLDPWIAECVPELVFDMLSPAQHGSIQTFLHIEPAAAAAAGLH